MTSGVALSRPARALRGFDDRLKVVLALAYVLAAALAPEGEWGRLCLLAGLLVCGYAAASVKLRTAVARMGFLLPIVVLLVLSLVLTRPDGPDDELGLSVFGRPLSAHAATHYGSILFGASLSVMAVALLAEVTRFDRIAAALGSLGCPRVLQMLLVVSYRYLVVLRDEARRMMVARDCRGRPPSVRMGTQVTGGMVGSLFVRSLDRSERVANAMMCRGFDGRLPIGERPPLRPIHAVVTVSLCIVIAGIAWFPLS